MKEIALLVAGIVFFLVAILHLLRLIFKVEVKMGRLVLPMWLSAAGFIVPLLLGLWMFSVRS